MLIEEDPLLPDDPSSPAAKRLCCSPAPEVAGEVELAHSPDREDKEPGDIQTKDETISDPSSPATTVPHVTGKQCVRKTQNRSLIWTKLWLQWFLDEAQRVLIVESRDLKSGSPPPLQMLSPPKRLRTHERGMKAQTQSRRRHRNGRISSHHLGNQGP